MKLQFVLIARHINGSPARGAPASSGGRCTNAGCVAVLLIGCNGSKSIQCPFPFTRVQCLIRPTARKPSDSGLGIAGPKRDCDLPLCPHVRLGLVGTHWTSAYVHPTHTRRSDCVEPTRAGPRLDVKGPPPPHPPASPRPRAARLLACANVSLICFAVNWFRHLAPGACSALCSFSFRACSACEFLITLCRPFEVGVLRALPRILRPTKHHLPASLNVIKWN